MVNWTTRYWASILVWFVFWLGCYSCDLWLSNRSWLTGLSSGWTLWKFRNRIRIITANTQFPLWPSWCCTHNTRIRVITICWFNEITLIWNFTCFHDFGIVAIKVGINMVNWTTRYWAWFVFWLGCYSCDCYLLVKTGDIWTIRNTSDSLCFAAPIKLNWFIVHVQASESSCISYMVICGSDDGF